MVIRASPRVSRRLREEANDGKAKDQGLQHKKQKQHVSEASFLIEANHDFEEPYIHEIGEGQHAPRFEPGD